ncbi:hypothetical protein KC332_g17819 [Hortaea werneckii]|nr:hypothetical protein KC350_g17970 [Hortaea werneckii]KAI6793493.1 hypothetical protein KC358_g17338 [Hortaea werneckii]KAI6896806.1 hypothetical protein KC348_g17905 [Hortaea werneckii]KAI6918252.1 hypothetical protein KC341_g17990 [Hortaea werneckii]KAI6951756.1 hypothetical protein KC321_g17949 [Hortaea werneckii]
MPPSTSQLLTKADMTKAFRLMDLPAELRIRIYEYAFTPRPLENPNKQSENFDSQAPSKALLLTNQLIHQEARPIYQESYRRFWTYSVSSVMKWVNLQPNTPLRERSEITRRSRGFRGKPQLRFALVEDHMHVELIYCCTARRLRQFVLSGNDHLHAQAFGILDS